MSVKFLGKLAATTLLAAGLAGCIDVNIDVAITSPTTAKATMTQVMNADVYGMVKMSAEGEGAQEDGFCAEGTLNENADGSATCVIVEEGNFADLDLGQDEGGMTFTEAGPGLVRVALPTADIQAELGAEDDMDEETRQMVEAFFEGRTMTIAISGAEVVDTNMTRTADGKRAEQVIPLLDLINGAANLPAEIYAVVRAP
ncbi:hypothetical protein NIM87_06500 [Devosia sp. XJ19-1]|uniref:Lipoprotein n=1 Tax=Devosia ureilytica TaxID=2952754 RepID=A0A9Q4AMM8_9HYPH|nr:hypothetical protein [Devosia ureilytica]MCP8883142.1 hypothetical protein [Devosia ureilytica]MCP8886490.1 hypothetical protein [Devosia ureilytica]